MNNKLMWKVILVVGLIGFSLIKLYPNFIWYSLPIDKRHEQAKRKNPMAEKVLPLGLDLQGGVHLVYQLDTSKLEDESDPSVTRAIEQNILVINNRIDGLGVANAFVARQGREFVVIQLPGVYESDQAKKLIGRTALLEFRLVKEDEALVDVVNAIREKDIQPDVVVSDMLPQDIKDMIPKGLDIMPQRDGGYLFVKDKPELTGRYLKKAFVDLGGQAQISGIAINFELDSEGAEIFRTVTGASVGERLAIVLDRQIQSAPTIRDRIPNGSGQITGSFSDQEAKDLANILNSGNLQAPMSVVEERSVGPEMGEDSIQAGMKAIIIGFLLVIVFMIVFYRTSGFLADIALVLNLLFMLTVLGILKSTLTMPGIAGIILSLAMAVDANILILERIREELAKGKQVRVAVEEGYEKAFSAILDGNITTILAAAFLFQFGTGPVKGFGITLMLGLIISMLTAFYVTHIFYDIWFSIKRPEKLNI